MIGKQESNGLIEQAINARNNRALLNDIAAKDAEIAYLKKQRDEFENELFAVFYLAVEKWFDDPEAELKKSNRATMAGKAREIALQAIEKESHRADEAEERLQKAEAQIERMKEKASSIEKSIAVELDNMSKTDFYVDSWNNLCLERKCTRERLTTLNELKEIIEEE